MTVLNYLPKSSVIARIPANYNPYQIDGVRWVGDVPAEDKILSLSGAKMLVMFYSDVSASQVAKTLAGSGINRLAVPFNPPPYVAFVEVAGDPLTVSRTLALSESVAWIGGVPPQLANSDPDLVISYCPGLFTQFGHLSEIAGVDSATRVAYQSSTRRKTHPITRYVIEGNGNYTGWDGSGLGSANLLYHFDTSTPQLSSDDQHSYITDALRTWSKYVQVTFSLTDTSGANRKFEYSFYHNSHTDGGQDIGGFSVGKGVYALTHTFDPPGFVEPLAGNTHFNLDITANGNGSWADSGRLYSTALHEFGHSLGLVHSSDPSDVMYATYVAVTDLTPDALNGIKQLYAATASAPPPTISSFTPAQGNPTQNTSQVGTTVTISGANLQDVSQCTFRW